MAIIEGYSMPDELYYHKEHTWVRVEGGNSARVGMNDFFQREAGSVVAIDLPDEGDEFSQGETCGKIQTGKWIQKVLSPLSGRVVEVNRALEDESTLLNEEPYGRGWIFLLKPTSLEGELPSLLQGEAIVAWLKGEIKKAEEHKKK